MQDIAIEPCKVVLREGLYERARLEAIHFVRSPTLVHLLEQVHCVGPVDAEVNVDMSPVWASPILDRQSRSGVVEQEGNAAHCQEH